jgi:hypothetical protein
LAEIKRSFDLPFGYSVTFVWCQDRAAAQWEPAFPQISRPKAQRKFFEAYRVARQSFYAEVAAVLGGSVLVCDFGNADYDGVEVVSPPTRH